MHKEMSQVAGAMRRQNYHIEMGVQMQDNLETQLLCYQNGGAQEYRAVEADVQICAHNNQDSAAERLTRCPEYDRDAVPEKHPDVPQSFWGSFFSQGFLERKMQLLKF